MSAEKDIWEQVLGFGKEAIRTYRALLQFAFGLGRKELERYGRSAGIVAFFVLPALGFLAYISLQVRGVVTLLVLGLVFLVALVIFLVFAFIGAPLHFNKRRKVSTLFSINWTLGLVGPLFWGYIWVDIVTPAALEKYFSEGYSDGIEWFSRPVGQPIVLSFSTSQDWSCSLPQARYLRLEVTGSVFNNGTNYYIGTEVTGLPLRPLLATESSILNYLLVGQYGTVYRAFLNTRGQSWHLSLQAPTDRSGPIEGQVKSTVLEPSLIGIVGGLMQWFLLVLLLTFILLTIFGRKVIPESPTKSANPRERFNEQMDDLTVADRTLDVEKKRLEVERQRLAIEREKPKTSQDGTSQPGLKSSRQRFQERKKRMDLLKQEAELKKAEGWTDAEVKHWYENEVNLLYAEERRKPKGGS